jgi:hypothetical protein
MPFGLGAPPSNRMPCGCGNSHDFSVRNSDISFNHQTFEPDGYGRGAAKPTLCETVYATGVQFSLFLASGRIAFPSVELRRDAEKACLVPVQPALQISRGSLSAREGLPLEGSSALAPRLCVSRSMTECAGKVTDREPMRVASVSKMLECSLSAAKSPPRSFLATYRPGIVLDTCASWKAV